MTPDDAAEDLRQSKEALGYRAPGAPTCANNDGRYADMVDTRVPSEPRPLCSICANAVTHRGGRLW